MSEKPVGEVKLTKEEHETMDALQESINTWTEEIATIRRRFKEDLPILEEELNAFKISLNALRKRKNLPVDESVRLNKRTESQDERTVADICFDILEKAKVRKTSRELLPLLLESGKVLESRNPVATITTALTRDNRFETEKNSKWEKKWGLKGWSIDGIDAIEETESIIYGYGKESEKEEEETAEQTDSFL